MQEQQVLFLMPKLKVNSSEEVEINGEQYQMIIVQQLTYQE